MTALLLLEHCLHADRRAKFTDFYSLWSHVFTFCPLKRKKSKSQDRPRRVHVSHLQDLSNPTQKYSCKIMQKNLLLAQNAPCSAAVKEIPILPALTANPPSSILISTKINGTQKQGKGGKCTDSGKDSLPCSQQSLTLIQTNKKKRSESQISPLMAGGSSSIITQNQLDQIPYEERSKAQSALSGTQMTKPLAVKHEDEYSNSFTPASSIFKSPEIVDGVSMKAIGIASNNFQSNLELQQQSLNSLTSLQNELQKKCSTSDCNPPELRKQMKSEDYRIASNMIQGNPSQLLSQQSGQPQSLAPYLQNTIVINSQQAPQFMNQQLLNANRQMDMSQLFLQNIGFQQPIQQQQQQQQNAQLLLQLNQQQQHLLQQSQQQQQQQSQQNQLQNHGQIFSYPISLNALQQQSQQQQSQQTQQQQSIQLLQAPIMQLPAHQLLQNQQLLQFHYQQQQQNQFPAQQQQSQQQNQWQQQQQQTQVIHDILSNEIIVLNPQTQQYIRYSPKQELLAGNPQQQGGITFNQIPQNLIDQMQAGMIIQQNSPLDAFSSLHQQKLQQQQQQQKMTQLFQ